MYTAGDFPIIFYEYILKRFKNEDDDDDDEKSHRRDWNQTRDLVISTEYR